MFWKRFVALCNDKGISPNGVCSELGLSNATATKWKNGSAPRATTVRKIADYFGVSVDYLLGNVQMDLQHFAAKEKEPSPTLDPRLLSLLDSMDADQLAEIEQYAEFILNKKKGSDK